MPDNPAPNRTAAPGVRRPLRDFGPIQLAGVLGWSRSEVERARDTGLIPGPDVDGRRWSAATVDELTTRAYELRPQIPPPAVGANRAAEHLADATGLDVDRHDVEALAAGGVVPVAGYYKDWALYDISDLDALTHGAEVDIVAGAVAERQAWLAASVPSHDAAERIGCSRLDLERLAADRGVTPGRFGRYATTDVERLATDDELTEQIRQDRRLGPDQAAGHLGIRRVDFDYIRAAGWVEPAGYVDVRVGRRKTVAVALYRTGDVEAVTDIQGVDWDAVRAVKPGDPSPLRGHAHLPASRAQAIRRFCADLGDRWSSIDVEARWINAADTWEITWRPDTTGHPTRAEIAAALAAHPNARHYRHQVRLRPTDPAEPTEGEP